MQSGTVALCRMDRARRPTRIDPRSFEPGNSDTAKAFPTGSGAPAASPHLEGSRMTTNEDAFETWREFQACEIGCARW